MSSRSNRRRWIVLIVMAAILFLVISASLAWANTGTSDPLTAIQAQLSPSPIQFDLPTLTPTLGPPTETPTRTPTPAGLPQVEALQDDTNIRSEPDITASRVGQIYPGTKYNVLGQRFQWYYIEVPEIPSGRAWVHNSVVRLDGDPAAIPQFELEDLPTPDQGLLSAQQTAQAISATPGAGATLTAQALITPTGIFTAAPGEATLAPGERPPTFTHPAASVTPVPYPRTNPPPESGGLAPIVPILALGALGLMGLLVSIMRRL